MKFPIFAEKPFFKAKDLILLMILIDREGDVLDETYLFSQTIYRYSNHFVNGIIQKRYTVTQRKYREEEKI